MNTTRNERHAALVARIRSLLAARKTELRRIIEQDTRPRLRLAMKDAAFASLAV